MRLYWNRCGPRETPRRNRTPTRWSHHTPHYDNGRQYRRSCNLRPGKASRRFSRVANWGATELSDTFDIWTEENETRGQQYQTDTGPIDILAISKDQKTILVIELKRGRASDAVVGQALRYMGYVKDVLAEPAQEVRGLVIALEDDQRLRRALSMVPSIEFKRHKVSF